MRRKSRLATSADPGIRNGTNAVSFAEAAVAATHRTNAVFLDTLAVAYAEAEQFDRAVAAEREAMKLPQTEPEKTDCGQRLKLYQANQPYRVPKAVRAQPQETK